MSLNTCTLKRTTITLPAQTAKPNFTEKIFRWRIWCRNNNFLSYNWFYHLLVLLIRVHILSCFKVSGQCSYRIILYLIIQHGMSIAYLFGIIYVPFQNFYPLFRMWTLLVYGSQLCYSPYFRLQLKYRIPPWEPSFLPNSSSSSTPAHNPVANMVSPQNLRVPRCTKIHTRKHTIMHCSHTTIG